MNNDDSSPSHGACSSACAGGRNDHAWDEHAELPEAAPRGGHSAPRAHGAHDARVALAPLVLSCVAYAATPRAAAAHDAAVSRTASGVGGARPRAD